MAINFAEHLRGRLRQGTHGQPPTSGPQTRRSSTSTTRWPDHEPYSTFESKVRALTESIGHFQSVGVQHHNGGSYKRVVVAHMRVGNRIADGIYRISRWGEKPGSPERETFLADEVRDEVAILQLLAKLEIPAPHLLAFDASRGNPLNCRYTLLEFSSGICLEDIFDNMTLPAKLNVVDGVVGFLVAMERVMYPRTGALCAHKQPNMFTKASRFLGGSMPQFKIDIQPFWTLREDETLDTLADLIPKLIRSNIDQEEDVTRKRQLDTVLKICIEMEEHEIFKFQYPEVVSTSSGILYHWDLFPRNIMVAQSGPRQEWKIDMVIDWDYLEAVPAVLTRRPPYWLWDRTEEDKMTHVRSDFVVDTDVDLLDPSR
ncbi:hypothetical protein K470DRAFT_295572 [Piedraia hortae CBS 480.64]|uniref:Aminoglycoside phosphotransferase domain-containing protein n=1 Tax=Piedraia hortae CBS 480.64 TaxID=1314780 RepID=A0A6A7BYF3_9PEZI|nr:hypothetical protein K470DRAFT_295572 [Piedraia hortae CBS 480.64]